MASEVTKQFMTTKMRVCAEEYLSGQVTGKKFNMRAAMNHAGYSEKAISYSTRLLNHPLFAAYIKEKLDEYAMGTAEILMRFSDIARSNVGNVVKLDATGSHLTLDATEVVKMKEFIKSFSYDANGHPKVEFHDPFAALLALARIRGMNKDGLDMGGVNVPITMTVQFVNPDGSAVGGVPNQPATPALTAGDDDLSIFEEEAELHELVEGETEG